MSSVFLTGIFLLVTAGGSAGDLPRGYTIPVVDLASEPGVITVDREAGQWMLR